MREVSHSSGIALAMALTLVAHDGKTQESPPPATPNGSTPFHFDIGGDGAYVTPPIRGGANPFGLGLGGHIGLTLGPFYAAGRVVDFLGGNDVDVTYRSLLAGIEIGYEVRVRAFEGAWLVLRPQIGAGDAVVFYTDPSLAKADVVTSASGGGASRSDTLSVNNVYVEPGATAMLVMGNVYASINGNALVLPGIVYGGADATTWISYGARASVGFRF